VKPAQVWLEVGAVLSKCELELLAEVDALEDEVGQRLRRQQRAEDGESTLHSQVVVAFESGLPDGISSNQNPNLGKFQRALDWKLSIYFTAISNILRTFGISYEHLVHFLLIWYNFLFWYLAPRKIWQRCFEWNSSPCFPNHVKDH
jgi:hypothetical protein